MFTSGVSIYTMLEDIALVVMVTHISCDHVTTGHGMCVRGLLWARLTKRTRDERCDISRTLLLLY